MVVIMVMIIVMIIVVTMTVPLPASLSLPQSLSLSVSPASSVTDPEQEHREPSAFPHFPVTLHVPFLLILHFSSSFPSFHHIATRHPIHPHGCGHDVDHKRGTNQHFLRLRGSFWNVSIFIIIFIFVIILIMIMIISIIIISISDKANSHRSDPVLRTVPQTLNPGFVVEYFVSSRGVSKCGNGLEKVPNNG